MVKKKPVRKQTRKKPVRKQTKRKPVRKQTKKKPIRKPTKRKPVRKSTKKKRIFRAGAPTGDDSDLKEKEDCVLKCETECETECNKKFLSKTQVKLQRSNLGSGPKKGHKLFLSREQIDADEEAAIARRKIMKDWSRDVTIDDPTDPVLASKEAREVLTEDDEWVEESLDMPYDAPVLKDFSDEKKLKKEEKEEKEDLVRRPSHFGRSPPQPRENPDDDALADIFKQDRDEYNTRVDWERRGELDQGSKLLAKGEYEGAKEIFNKILDRDPKNESAKKGLHQAEEGIVEEAKEARQAQRRERGSGARQLVTGARELLSSAVERVSDVGRRD